MAEEGRGGAQMAGRSVGRGRWKGSSGGCRCENKEMGMEDSREKGTWLPEGYSQILKLHLFDP